MRVDNQNINSLGNSGSSSSIRSIGQDDASQAGSSESVHADTVSLSSASSLIALAKNISSPERLSRIADLSAQLRAGSYQTNLVDTTQAILQASTA